MDTMSNDNPHAHHEELPTVMVSKSSAINTNGIDVTSENGDGERPVREKLKKTSIAQMANGTTPPRSVVIEEAEVVEQPSTLAANQKEDTPMENGVDAPETQSRPITKRPLAESDEAETLAPDVMDTSINGHARKKSRDERSIEIPKQEWEHVSSPESSPDSMEEDKQDKEDQVKEAADPSAVENIQGNRETKAEMITVTPQSTEPADQDMKEILSPRKKRSRDQFEAESQERDQKVAATEQSRLRRRSLELKRSSPTDETEETGSDIASAELEKPTGDKSDLAKTDAANSNVWLHANFGLDLDANLFIRHRLQAQWPVTHLSYPHSQLLHAAHHPQKTRQQLNPLDNRHRYPRILLRHPVLLRLPTHRPLPLVL